MSGNALPLLLAWMKDHPTHGDWDFIAALSPAVFNQSLQAGYVQRLAEQGAMEGIDARIAIPSTGITHHLFGYHLAAPEFELTVPSYETARFTQRTAVAGGVHVVRDSMQGVIGVSAHDALDGLCLRQTLDLIDGGRRCPPTSHCLTTWSCPLANHYRNALRAASFSNFSSPACHLSCASRPCWNLQTPQVMPI
ncbi:hypothetical protein HU761_03095 [Pseudomonas sp. SWRI59]|uniref:hypothetical protein n=1 Tax=unclassified Pseudomonas TaxID=196821 RepID=UPI0016471CEA|nr:MULTISPECIES: hypothetical protein [unclassified Pseudomonas]MBC3500391.1 hypothetical protein [Pseudomonas sp. SWRI59]MBC3507925.1 hypothetical protein [Pseudomonas sp. SWRI68]